MHANLPIVEAEDAELREWYASEIQREGSLMGWTTLGQLETQMKGMLWLPEVHSPKLFNLCRGWDYVSPSLMSKGSPEIGPWKPALHLARFG